MVRLELGIRVLGLHLENDDHEGAHEEGTIHDSVSRISRGAIVEDPVFLEILIAQEASKLSREPVNHRKVQGTKIFVERKVRKIIINIEEEGVLVILWRLQVGHPE